MKKQINTAIKAHLLPNLFILLSLLAIGVIPFAQAQRNTTKQVASKAVPATAAAATKLSGVHSGALPAKTGPSFSIFRAGTPPAPAAPQVVLYDQYNNAGANATLSATFTDFPTFSADLADDFVVPTLQTWTIMSVDADGVYFNGAGPATTFNVYIYANAGGLPGAVVYSQLNSPFVVSGTTYTVNLTTPAVLTCGTYWVEVQANMTFNPMGEWGWTDRTVQSGNPAAWQNPGGGFGVCPTWAPKMATCVPSSSGPDQVYRINGTSAAGPVCGPTPTPTPTPPPICYNTSTGSGTIVPGTTDVGNHCDDCSTPVTLPFPITVYGQTFSTVNVASNGSVDFVGTQAPFTTGCVTLPSANWTMALLPYQDDLRTDNPFAGCNAFPGATCGIFTSVTGTAPNRDFHIEWRATFFGNNNNSTNFEVRFHEGVSSFFDVFYGLNPDNGTGETSGIQKTPTGPATTFSCGTGTLTNGLKVTYTAVACPTPTPTPTPGCGIWNPAQSYPVTDVRYGFAQTATDFYVFGGVSNGTRIANVNKYNIATGMWTSLAPMPFTSEAPTCALMASTGLVYCAEGDTGSGFQAYNIATNTWSGPLAPTPNANNYGSASGAFNGNVFLVGGTTGFINNVWVYNVGLNTWSAGTAAADTDLLAGYHQVGQYLYLVGGWTGGGPTGLTTSRRLDMTSAPGVWSNGPTFPMGRADFGLAYDPATDKLYALGGDVQGGAFFDSTNEVDESPTVASWPAGTWVASPPNLPLPNRQANQAGFNGNGAIWSVGGIDGSTFTFLSDVYYRPNVCGPTVVSAVSRITHTGGCGTFDIPLPLTGTPGIECRSQTGNVGNYTIVVTFSGNETVASAAVTCHNPGTGTGTTGAVSGSGTPVITIPLTGVSNAQTMTVHITGTTNVDIPISILIGDTNGNGAVNAADIAQTKGRSGQAVTAANFRSDVNANCAINAGDIAAIKANSGTAVAGTCP